jgi:hypothetical protein
MNPATPQKEGQSSTKVRKATPRDVRTLFSAAMAIALAMNAAHTATAAAVEQVLLVTDGKPVATIVIAKEPTCAACFAAAELQYHVQKITGAVLPVARNNATIDGTRILVGESEATQAIKLFNKDFEPQEYLVQVRAGTIVLMGRDKNDRRLFDYQDSASFPDEFDEQGTCYAVYDFLERFCDVRWYLPTEMGIACPSAPTLAVRQGEVRRSPAMKYRYQDPGYPLPADLCGDTIKGLQPIPILPWREQFLWVARNRVGGEPYRVTHSFEGYYDRFQTEHPDWFAQGYKGKSSQMCYTNPGFIQQVAQDARDYFDGKGLKPGGQALGDYFSLVPMDTGGWCKCSRCQALLHDKATRGVDEVNDRVSDYIFYFVNQVAREVRRTHPDKYVSTLGYWEYAYPPRSGHLEPNVAVTLCLDARMVYNLKVQDNNRRILRAWRDESSSRYLSLWLYYCYPSYKAMTEQFRCFPGFFAQSVVKQFREYRLAGVRGVYFEPSYLSDGRRSPLFDQLETYVTWKLADDPVLDGKQLIREFFSRYYGAAAEPMRALYTAIEETYSNPANYPVDPGLQSEQIAWGHLGTEKRMAEFGKLMDAARAAATTDLEKQRVALFDKGIWNYMQAGRKAFNERSKLFAPTIQKANVPRIAVAGGDPNKVNWSSATVLGNWRGLTGDPTDRKIEARLAHDGRFLYLQLEERLDPQRLRRTDNTVWGEDEWEIYVARQRARPYRQMGVNANAVHLDIAWGEPSAKWDSGAVVVSDTKSTDHWTTRIAFPMAKLLPDGVEPDRTFYLNILRATNSKDALAWVPTFGGFHEPSRLGEITLSE